MNMSRRTFGKGVFGLVASGIALAKPAIVRAAGYPSKPVTYIVPFAPGGESDVTARMQQKFFAETTGQNLVIQNIPGAGGATGWARLNRGFKPDGYTIAGTIVPHIILQPSMKEVGYRTEDIHNIYFFHYTPDAVLVRADSEYTSLQELLDAAKADPGRITMAGSGTNSANHLANKRLEILTGAQTTYIPFKGSAPAMTALLGGMTQGAMSYTTQAVNAGEQVRVLAVATEKRHPALPDAPTFRELGIDYTGGAYRGVALPAGTDGGVRTEISSLIGQINANPDFQNQMTRAGYTVIDVPIDAVSEFMAQKKNEYAQVIEQLKASQ
jgi:tripartite-type tricarboxylate transporter receptor subunit TctC